MKLDINEKWIVCRVCLKGDPLDEMKEIFNKVPAEDLSDMLHQCGGIPIKSDDNLPDKICSKCVRCLRVAHRFRLTCQRSHEHLTELIATEFIIEEEDDKEQIAEKIAEQVIEVQEVVDDEGGIKLELKTEFDENDGKEQNLTDSEQVDYEEFVPVESEEYAEYEDYEEVDPTETVTVANEKLEEDEAEDVLTTDDEYQPPPKQAKTRFTITKAKSNEHVKTVAVNEPKRRGRKPKGDKPLSYICDVCGNIYQSQARLTEHMKFHSDIKPHECEICGRGFIQAQQLARHMNTHTGNRPYKCNYCPAAFADRSTKTKHHRIHTKERPYSCDVCLKTFTYSDNLKFHKMIHTGEKPHVCDICGKGFTKAYKMRVHRVTHEKRGLIPPSNVA